MAKKRPEAKAMKIRAIPNRRLNLYKRLMNNPERISARHRRAMRMLAVQLVVVVLVCVELFLLYQKNTLERDVDRLHAYVTAEENVKSAQYADELSAQAALYTGRALDVQSAVMNMASYPLVTSKVFDTLERSCPDKVDITITGFAASSGTLSFDAVAPVVTDVSEVIDVLKELDIFRNVYYTGYRALSTGDGYTVKVVCLLDESAGK